jgi:ABC-type glycerol-3-phosphate transport system substrate-binding protein
LPEQADNHEASWKFIEFLSAPQNMARWNVGTPDDPGTLLPPRRSLLENPRIFEYNPILQGFADAMVCGVTTTISNPDWPAIEEALNEALGRAIYGEVSASDALDEAAAEAESIMAG